MGKCLTSSQKDVAMLHRLTGPQLPPLYTRDMCLLGGPSMHWHMVGAEQFWVPYVFLVLVFRTVTAVFLCSHHTLIQLSHSVVGAIHSLHPLQITPSWSLQSYVNTAASAPRGNHHTENLLCTKCVT